MWDCAKFLDKVYQASLYLWPTGRLTQLLIASFTLQTHCASKRVSVWESLETLFSMWSRKFTTNSPYSEGSPPNFINSIFGRVGPCLSASAMACHAPLSACDSDWGFKTCWVDCWVRCRSVCNNTSSSWVWLGFGGYWGVGITSCFTVTCFSLLHMSAGEICSFLGANGGPVTTGVFVCGVKSFASTLSKVSRPSAEN